MEQLIKFINSVFYYCRLIRYSCNNYIGTIYKSDVLLPILDDDEEITFEKKEVFCTPYVKMFLETPSIGGFDDYMQQISSSDFIYSMQKLTPKSKDGELYFI